MKIGEVAKVTGLSVSNIRFYEKKRTFDAVAEQGKPVPGFFRGGCGAVEKISLLFSGHITLYEVLCSQEQELRDQMKQLEGAAALCDFMKAEENVETMNAERYLYYMETEKQQGRSFVDVLELAEDLVDYTGGFVFPWQSGIVDNAGCIQDAANLDNLLVVCFARSLFDFCFY